MRTRLQAVARIATLERFVALLIAAVLPGCPRQTPSPEVAVEPPQLLAHEELTFVESIGVGELRARLDTWFDGPPADIRTFAGSVGIPGVGEAEGVASMLTARVSRILALPRSGASPDWLLWSKAPTGAQGRGFIMCVDSQCRELWRDVPTLGAIPALCRLYGESGCIGVVFAQEHQDNVVGRALDGRELFRLPASYNTMALASHPRLPDLFVQTNGRISLFDSQGRQVDKPHFLFSGPTGGFLYAEEAVLVPGADGRARVVAAGAGKDLTPLVVCCDTRLREDWRVKMPDGISALALLEPAGEALRFAVGTEAGDVFVLDIDGCLIQQISLARDAHASGCAIRSLYGGPLADGRYGLAANLTDVTLLYAVN